VFLLQERHGGEGERAAIRTLKVGHLVHGHGRVGATLGTGGEGIGGRGGRGEGGGAGACPLAAETAVRNTHVAAARRIVGTRSFEGGLTIVARVPARHWR